MRILLIEDDSATARSIELMLKSEGFNVYTTDLGEEGVDLGEGAKVDTVWEATIGNLGRVIYVFEVQTKGSIDSLIINLLKSLNNPAVQGIVAVSDLAQIERIKKEVATLIGPDQKVYLKSNMMGK